MSSSPETVTRTRVRGALIMMLGCVGIGGSALLLGAPPQAAFVIFVSAFCCFFGVGIIAAPE